MTNLSELTIKEARDGLENGKFSSYQLVEAVFDTIESRDKEIGAYLSMDKEAALKAASEVSDDGLLSGIPIAVKDIIVTTDHPTTAGSKILEGYTSMYDATVVKKLKDEGAIIIGKTNLDEFAMGSSTENSSYHLTRNPHDSERVPGGSSGGSAAAVAADMSLGALGTDTGGSIRQPAAFCNIVGLKPTYGAVSRFGSIALASSLDQIGPMTKTVEDAAILFRAISGHDPRDSTSNPKFMYKDLGASELTGLTIGIPEEYFIEGLSSRVGDTIEQTIKTFKRMGFSIKKVSLPHTKYALSAYYIILPAEASTNLARYDGIRYGVRGSKANLQELYFSNRGDGFGAEVKRRIILGTFVLSAGYYDAYYSKAQKVRALIREDFDEVFKNVDVLLTPTTPTVPFKFGLKMNSPLDMYLSDIFTLPANLAGIPGISIPAKENKGDLPVGFQLLGNHWSEASLLGLGQLYESFSG